MNEEKRTWSEVLDALQTTHTMSIRDVCMMLKASRTWVNKYIRPHVDTLYLNSNIRGDSQIGCNWVQLASDVLGKEMTESTWINTAELMELLQRSVISVTKQTKYLPISSLIKGENKKEEYCLRRSELLIKAKELSRKSNPVAQAECVALYRKADQLHLEYVDEAAKVLLENICSVTLRGRVDRTDVDYPGDFDPEKWVAPHDVKQYGDTDEDVYRRFFRSGAIRIELAVPDADGVVGSKVYYIKDPELLWPASQWDKIVTVSEAAWLKYKAAKEG